MLWHLSNQYSILKDYVGSKQSTRAREHESTRAREHESTRAREHESTRGREHESTRAREQSTRTREQVRVRTEEKVCGVSFGLWCWFFKDLENELNSVLYIIVNK